MHFVIYRVPSGEKRELENSLSLRGGSVPWHVSSRLTKEFIPLFISPRLQLYSLKSAHTRCVLASSISWIYLSFRCDIRCATGQCDRSTTTDKSRRGIATVAAAAAASRDRPEAKDCWLRRRRPKKTNIFASPHPKSHSISSHFLHSELKYFKTINRKITSSGKIFF